MGPLVFGLEPAVAYGLGLLGIGTAASIALKDTDLSFPNEVRGACLVCHNNAESQTEVKQGTYTGSPPKDWSGAFPDKEPNVLHNESSKEKGEKQPSKDSESEAAKNRKENLDKDIPENALGPSGKPKINTKKHTTKKRAKDAAQERSRKGGKPEHHQNPTKGEDPHFHPDGKKHREHHTYPKKGFPGNKEY